MFQLVHCRAAEQIVVQPARQFCLVVDAAAERRTEGVQSHVGVDAFLGVAQKKTFAEIAKPGAALQPDISGEHRAAGDAGENIDMLEQGGFLAEDAHPGFFDLFENAITEGRGAGAAAGKSQSD